MPRRNVSEEMARVQATVRNIEHQLRVGARLGVRAVAILARIAATLEHVDREIAELMTKEVASARKPKAPKKE
jgi:hypothetical protein